MKDSPRQRMLAVLRGQTPDRVPALADLSWWYAAHGGGKFVPSVTGNEARRQALLDLHHQLNVGIHLNLGTFFRERHHPSVRVTTGIEGERFIHRLETPVGTLVEEREWSPLAWSWPITHHMVQKLEDLKVIRYVFERIGYETAFDEYERVNRAVGEIGLPFVQAPYTGMGFLISRYAGVERAVLMACDEPEEVRATVDTINAAHLKVFTMLAEGPGEVLFVSDNLSADVQSPAWFSQWSGEHYRAMARIAHAHGKPLSVHIDGRLGGLLRAVDQCGIDAADAVTPAPWGDLTPQQCRDEAGPKLVLSGGVPPNSFLPAVPMKVFESQVEAWLDLRRQSPALIVAPGDQLPPGSDLDRLRRMIDMAEAAGF